MLPIEKKPNAKMSAAAQHSPIPTSGRIKDELKSSKETDIFEIAIPSKSALKSRA